MTTAFPATQVLRTVQAMAPKRSAWKRGVLVYAEELLEEHKEIPVDYEERKHMLLNGARDWRQYSDGGCALVYDYDIAERLCTPSELKRTRDGERQPSSRETWLDVQARALYQAACLIGKAVHALEAM